MRVWSRGVAVSAAVWLSALVGAASATPTLQQTYDAAQAAYDKSDWAGAAAGFATLLPATPGVPLDHSQAVMAYRYADSLMHLRRTAEARGWIARALPRLRADADRGVLGEALVVQGDLARTDYDYVAAAQDYDQAIAAFGDEAVSLDGLDARIRLGEVDATTDPAHVDAVLSPLLNDADFRAHQPPAVRAGFEDLAARAAMNRGDAPVAQKLIAQAISDSGRLTEDITVLQSYVRADAGLIAQMNHDDAATRRYLAYSGAGHMMDLNWVGKRIGELPVCGDGAEGARPDDSVVVRFRIADDGTVTDATPIYASRPGLIGVAFARVVSKWRWDPAEVKSVSPFWRSTLELQLRCVTRPPARSLDAGAWKTAMAWLHDHGLVVVGSDLDGGADDHGFWAPDDPQLKRPDGAVLEALLSPLEYGYDVKGLWSRLDAVHAPPAVYALLVKRYAVSEGRATSHAINARRTAHAYSVWTPRFERQFPDDPDLDWLWLEQAIQWQAGGDFRAAAPLLERVVAAPPERLGDNDPIRKVALLHQAMGIDRLGAGVAAQDTLAQSGLTAAQCTLFDTHPLATNTAIDSSAFPDAAMNWNFEGHVEEAYDIKDDGSVDHVRTVVAYPPYIFSGSTERAVADFRFLPPRLGGHAVGCEDARTVVNFRTH